MFSKLNRLWLRSLAKAGKARMTSASKMMKAMQPAARPRPAARKPVAPRPARDLPDGVWHHAIFAGGKMAARRMRYRLFLPEIGNPSPRGMPLLVMLHGCQQNADDFAAGTGMNRLAAAKGYAVLYPEQSARAHPHRCWRWYDAATQGGGGDIETIAGMIERLVEQHGFDRQRIYVCGLSAGAAMAQLLALSHPRLIAAVGMHSGPVLAAPRTAVGAYGLMQHGSTRPMTPIRTRLAADPAFPGMPAILITGNDDDVVRPVNQLQLVQQFTGLNHHADLTAAPPVTTLFGRACAAWPHRRAMQVSDFKSGTTVVVRSVQIQGLGHAWSGGDETFAFNARGPRASKLMLAFFARHRRRI
jgi:poly(hydroxyalkanoate) depolymerase family esterase